jgi:hypothetical protein
MDAAEKQHAPEEFHQKPTRACSMPLEAKFPARQ